MKQRIKYLEDEQQRRDRDNYDTPNQHETQNRTSSFSRPRLLSTSPDVGTPRRAADIAANEVEYLSLAAMSGGNKNDQDLSSSSTFRQIMERIVALDGTNPASAKADTLSPTTSEATLGQIISRMRIAVGKDYTYFVQTVVAGFSWCLPYVSEKTYLTALDTAFQASNGSTPTAAPSPDTTAAASLVLTLGITLSSYHADLHSQASQLIEISQQVLPQVLSTASDVAAIQCLTLQAILSLHYPSAGSTWHLLGVALGKAVSAGLHRSASVNTADTESTQASSTFWTLYTLDRMLSSLMGRPLGLEDNDVSRDLPELPLYQSLTDKASVSAALFVWRTHHAHMLSQWRQSTPSNFDLDANLASHEYWKESYHEVCQRWTQIHTVEAQSNTTTATADMLPRAIAIMQKEEATLSCRALIHLLDLATTRLPVNNPSLLNLRGVIIPEASHLIDIIHETTIDSGNVAVSFPDAYDALAAAVMYIFCIYDPSTSESSTFRLGVAQMKTITASIDVIQNVARRFKPLRGYKDVIWGLLQILEAKTAGRDVDPKLLRGVWECEVEVPSHIRRLIQICAQT